MTMKAKDTNGTVEQTMSKECDEGRTNKTPQNIEQPEPCKTLDTPNPAKHW